MSARKKIAILATDGFEQSELTEPRRALAEAGHEVAVVSLETGKIRGVKGHEPGDTVDVDQVLADVAPDDFDALVLPGGVYNPDTLRQEAAAVAFARSFMEAGKTVAAICHGPWLLVEADVLRGRRATSFPSIRTDMRNAGANWVDGEVVTDGNLITSRSPDDLEAFCRTTLEALADGPAEREGAATVHPIRAGA
ncbi:MAG: type 1 glutamine amidotransferase domain-containing protein [Sneathiellaceae bacterium]